MIVVAVFLFLVASVAAAGADAAVDDEVQFRRRVYAARTALRGFESAIEGAFKRATDRQSAFDWGGGSLSFTTVDSPSGVVLEDTWDGLPARI